MRSKGSWPLLFLTLAGCTLLLPEAFKFHPTGVNTVVLGKTTVLSSMDSLVFQSQLSILEYYGYLDVGGVLAKDFTFTSPGHYRILDFRDSTISGDPRAAVMILEDESGDYSTLDPHNFRAKMINKLCQDIQPPGSFVVGGFSRQGRINAPVEFSSAAFTADWRSQQDFIFDLAGRTGGTSSLYDALAQALNRLKLEPSPDKNIVVLAHAGDSGSTASLNDVIVKAVSGGIRIHVLFLGDSGAVGVMPQLSNLTGGMFAVLPTEQELITVFNHLYRLMSGEKYVYMMRVSYRPESGILSVAEVTHTLKAVDYITGKDYNPVVIYTRILQ